MSTVVLVGDVVGAVVAPKPGVEHGDLASARACCKCQSHSLIAAMTTVAS